MRVGSKWIVIVVVAGMLAGCEQLAFFHGRESAPAEPPAEQSPPAEAPGRANYMADSAVRGDDNSQNEGAVDVALEWSKKYAKAAEQLVEAQKANQQLTEKNKKLLAELAKAQVQLEEAQKELADANEMILQLGKQNREWRKNVLGFREELLQAEKVQLDKLQKIIVLLGGEVPQKPKPGAASPQAASAEGVGSELPTGQDG